VAGVDDDVAGTDKGVVVGVGVGEEGVRVGGRVGVGEEGVKGLEVAESWPGRKTGAFTFDARRGSKVREGDSDMDNNNGCVCFFDENVEIKGERWELGGGREGEGEGERMGDKGWQWEGTTEGCTNKKER